MLLQRQAALREGASVDGAAHRLRCTPSPSQLTFGRGRWKLCNSHGAAMGAKPGTGGGEANSDSSPEVSPYRASYDCRRNCRNTLSPSLRGACGNQRRQTLDTCTTTIRKQACHNGRGQGLGHKLQLTSSPQQHPRAYAAHNCMPSQCHEFKLCSEKPDAYPRVLGRWPPGPATGRTARNRAPIATSTGTRVRSILYVGAEALLT
jgi:hypothetical protein